MSQKRLSLHNVRYLDESTRHVTNMLKDVYKDAYRKDQFGLKSSLDQLGSALSDSSKQGSLGPEIHTVDPLFSNLLRSMIRVQDAEFGNASSKVTARDLRAIHETTRAILTQWDCTKDVRNLMPRERTTADLTFADLLLLREEYMVDPVESLCDVGKGRLQYMVGREARVDLKHRELQAVYLYATTKADTRYTGTADFGRSEAIYGTVPLLI